MLLFFIKMSTKKPFLFISFLCFFTFFSPSGAQKVKNLDYQEVKKLYLTNTDDTYRIQLVNDYLKLAKAKKSWDDVAKGYMLFENFNLYNNAKVSLLYSDSIMKIKHLLKSQEDLGIYYYTRGKTLNILKSHEKAIDALMFNINLDLKDNYYYLSLFEIGNIKMLYLNDYLAANKLFEEFHNYMISKKNTKDFNSHFYLHSIFGLSYTQLELKNIEYSYNYNIFGYKESKKYNSDFFKNQFILNQAEYHIKKNNPQLAIDSIKKTIDYIVNNDLITNQIWAFSNLGLSYNKLQNEELSIKYFIKVDSIFKINKTFYPKFTVGYLNLIDHYKKEKNYEKQLYYTNQLLKIDSTFRKDYKTIINKLQKDYDVPQLTKEKEALIKQLENKGAYKNYGLWALLVVALSSLALAYYKHLQKKKVEHKIQEISQTAQQPILQLVSLPEEPVGLQKDPLPINIVLDLEIKLKKFEKNLGFLKSDLDSKSLAADLDTNVKYLSVFINQYGKGLKFNDYINQLRINYVIQQLDSQPKWQNYSIDALAQKAGFNRADTFSKAFYKLTDFKPSEFIKNLKKHKANIVRGL